jgi:hypothetical protein
MAAGIKGGFKEFRAVEWCMMCLILTLLILSIIVISIGAVFAPLRFPFCGSSPPSPRCFASDCRAPNCVGLYVV